MSSNKVVVLDAGHGGKDSGAVGHGYKEKDLALAIVKKTADLLKRDYKNVTVYLTRSTDVFISLTNRAKFSNSKKADIFVSVHLNSSNNPNANGYESFIAPSTKSQNMLYNVHREVSEYFRTNHSRKDRRYERKSLSVLRGTHAPAILTENLFISNKHEVGIVKNNINGIAKAHAVGIAKALNLKPKSGSGTGTSSGTITNNKGGLTMEQYKALDKRLKELEKANEMTATLKGDLEAFLKEANRLGYFSKDHSKKVKDMDVIEGVVFALNFLGRLSKNKQLPKMEDVK